MGRRIIVILIIIIIMFIILILLIIIIILTIIKIILGINIMIIMITILIHVFIVLFAARPRRPTEANWGQRGPTGAQVRPPQPSYPIFSFVLGPVDGINGAPSPIQKTNKGMNAKNNYNDNSDTNNNKSPHQLAWCRACQIPSI